jgi:hypothetical protein
MIAIAKEICESKEEKSEKIRGRGLLAFNSTSSHSLQRERADTKVCKPPERIRMRGRGKRMEKSNRRCEYHSGYQ